MQGNYSRDWPGLRASGLSRQCLRAHARGQKYIWQPDNGKSLANVQSGAGVPGRLAIESTQNVQGRLWICPGFMQDGHRLERYALGACDKLSCMDGTIPLELHNSALKSIS